MPELIVPPISMSASKGIWKEASLGIDEVRGGQITITASTGWTWHELIYNEDKSIVRDKNSVIRVLPMRVDPGPGKDKLGVHLWNMAGVESYEIIGKRDMYWTRWKMALNRPNKRHSYSVTPE